MSAWDEGLRLLSYRSYSCRELRDKLLQKRFSEADADAAVERMRSCGYLDDARYAAELARHYARKSYGAQRIRSELNRRGIPREYWDEAISELPDSSDELDRYLEKHPFDPADPDAKRKLTAALSRRGYTWEEIRQALERQS